MPITMLMSDDHADGRRVLRHVGRFVTEDRSAVRQRDDDRKRREELEGLTGLVGRTVLASWDVDVEGACRWSGFGVLAAFALGGWKVVTAAWAGIAAGPDDLGPHLLVLGVVGIMVFGAFAGAVAARVVHRGRTPGLGVSWGARPAVT